jgi:hypothetical protein
MNTSQDSNRKDGFVNDTPPFMIQSQENDNSTFQFDLSVESTSTLLTMVIPEESVSKEEETELLRNPRGLWTVLVVSTPTDFVSRYKTPHNLTPISQFLRGIVASLCTQGINAQHIHRNLEDVLAHHDNSSIFDDENFTKSILYHRTIKTCGELAESIASNLRFMGRLRKTQLDKLCREAHTHEKPGINYWYHQIEEEMSNLEELREQILALSVQVQESVSSLVEY